jgi:hypothetical protein
LRWSSSGTPSFLSMQKFALSPVLFNFAAMSCRSSGPQ